MNQIEAIRKIAATASEERDPNDLLGEIQGICREALSVQPSQPVVPEGFTFRRGEPSFRGCPASTA